MQSFIQFVSEAKTPPEHMVHRKAGAAARRQGHGMDKLPHDLHTPEGKHWIKGWKTEDSRINSAHETGNYRKKDIDEGYAYEEHPDEYQSGHNAASTGKSEKDNPHPKGSKKGWAWVTGHRDSQERSKHRSKANDIVGYLNKK